MKYNLLLTDEESDTLENFIDRRITEYEDKLGFLEAISHRVEETELIQHREEVKFLKRIRSKVLSCRKQLSTKV